MSTAPLPRQLHLDIHLIQSYPFSVLNRDRQNAPKTAVYGGVSRARLSSQNSKRHVREKVEKSIGLRAVRTRGVPQEVAARLGRQGWEPGPALAAGQMVILAAAVKGLGIADTGGTNSLLFLPESALDELAAIANDHRGEITQAAAEVAAEAKKAEEKAAAKARRKKAAQQNDESEPPAEAGGEEEPAIGEDSLLAKLATKLLPKTEILTILRTRNACIAAFGRMLANEPGSAVAGAVQMAHGLTTHAAGTQLDYFTAVDDLLKDAEEETGAAHMGDNRYTSGTFYRYASLNITELLSNLDSDTKTAKVMTEEFLRAFATAVLPAKSTGTAPFTAPHLVYAALRTDRPINLVGAFESAVPATPKGYVTPSLEALNKHAAAHHAFLGTSGLSDHAHTTMTDLALPALGDRAPGLDALVQRVQESIAKAQL